MNHLVGSEDVNIPERSLTFVTDQSPLLVSPELLLVLLQVDLHHQGVFKTRTAATSETRQQPKRGICAITNKALVT